MRWIFILAVMAGCGKDMGEQTLNVKAQGLWLTANPLDAPPGALSRADNIVIRRPNIVEPRRGQALDTELSGGDVNRAMAAFEGMVLAYLDNGSVVVRTAAGSSSVVGTGYTNPDNNPLRFSEAGGGLYFTTTTGPQRMDSPTSAPVPAGSPPGLEGRAAVTGSSGWLGGGTVATGTVTLGGGAGDVTITINGTAVGPVAFSVDDTTTAANTATAINSNGILGPLVTASHAGPTINIVTDSGGTAVNYTLTASRSAGTATASGPTLTGATDGSTVGYRVLWGSRDGDGALLLGAPSSRFIIENNAGATRNVAVTSPIPSGVVAGTHFLQVYRTVLTTTDGSDPGEDMAQVAEVFPAAAQVTAGVLTVTDVAAFANGPTAYFSPSSGPGLADAHEQPPLLTDAIQYKGHLFAVVQKYRQTLELDLLGTGSGALETGNGLLFQQNGAFVFAVAGGSTEDAFSGTFKVYTAGTAAQNIEDTARSLVRVLNEYIPSIVYAQYVSGPDDLPGKMVLTARNLDEGPIEVRAFGTAAPWVPNLGSRIFTTISRTGTTVTVTAVPASAVQGLIVGATIDLATVDPLPADPDFPLGVKTITGVNTGAGTFTYTEAGAAGAGTKDVYVFETTADPLLMNQDAVPGSWATSTFQQPDAWPPRFRYQVGGPNTRLDRITAQGDALLFWTSDGLYRLTGETENDFTLRPVDPTIQLAGTNTPATMGNKAFALTTQGVVSVTDLGVEKVSTPIDQALLPYYGSTQAKREILNGSAFGVAYQSENEYYLFLPNLDSETSLSPAMAYVFNTQTSTWARQTWNWEGVNENGEELMAGVENPVDGYLYLGVGGVSTEVWITRERKDRALSDYQDSDGVGIPMDVAYQVETAKNPGALKQWIEVTAMLERPQPSSMDFYCSTEIDTSEEGGTIASEGNSNLRTYLPLNKSRSARLTLGFRHDAALEKPTILGLSVVYNTNSTRVGR